MSDTGNQIVNGQGSGSPRFVGACGTFQLFPGQAAVNGNSGIVQTDPGRIAQCGEQKTWIVGVNWYLNDYVRLMFNYAQSDLSNFPTTPANLSLANATEGFDGATIRGFGMRAQVDW